MAIFLPPVFRNGRLLGNIFRLLFHLTYAALLEFSEFKQIEGVKYSIKYLRFLQESPLNPPRSPENSLRYYLSTD